MFISCTSRNQWQQSPGVTQTENILSPPRTCSIWWRSAERFHLYSQCARLLWQVLFQVEPKASILFCQPNWKWQLLAVMTHWYRWVTNWLGTRHGRDMLIKLVLFGFFVLFIAETEENCGLYWNTLKYGHPMFSCVWLRTWSSLWWFKCHHFLIVPILWAMMISPFTYPKASQAVPKVETSWIQD